MMKLSNEQALALLPKLSPAARAALEEVIANSGRGSKFGNRFVVVDGVLFHSEGEYKRWCDLRLEERTGLIRELKRQQPFKVNVRGRHVFTYFADFTYQRRKRSQWLPVVEDFKGYRTDIYKLKKKIIEALHGFSIFESRARSSRSRAQH